MTHPPDEYLTKVGRLVYIVGGTEWLVLAELRAIAAHVPAHLTVDKLADKSTGAIADQLLGAVSKIAHPAVREFIAFGGAALAEMKDWRNDVLHARPAASPEDGTSLLYRWLASKPGTNGRPEVPGKAMAITHAWLDGVLDKSTALNRALDAMRIPLRQTVGGV